MASGQSLSPFFICTHKIAVKFCKLEGSEKATNYMNTLWEKGKIFLSDSGSTQNVVYKML